MLLYDRLIELYKRDDPSLSKIFLMLNGIKTDFEIVSKTPNINLNFMTQDGGAKMTIPIDKIRYSYNVEYARPIDAKYSGIYFTLHFGWNFLYLFIRDFICLG